MKYLILLVGGLVLISLPAHRPARYERTLGGTHWVTRQKIEGACISESDLARSLVSFSSPALKPAWHRELLLSYARKSSQCRAKIITALLRAMDKPDLNLERDQESFFMWHYGGEVLRGLQASEALDLLITNLGVTDGESINITHYPAVETVIGIGVPAIPKLKANLLQEARPRRRSLIIFCIAKIGGTSAKEALVEALPKENDKCASNFIRLTLKLFRNPRHPNQVPMGDADWAGAFLCMPHAPVVEGKRAGAH